jgi:hypothetical protein
MIVTIITESVMAHRRAGEISKSDAGRTVLTAPTLRQIAAPMIG